MLKFTKYLKLLSSDKYINFRDNNWLATISKEDASKLQNIFDSIINYYEPAFNADSFLHIINWMPYILKMNFDGKRFLGRENVFYIEKDFKD